MRRAEKKPAKQNNIKVTQLPLKQHVATAPSLAEIEQLVMLFNQQNYAALETRASYLTIRFPQHGIGWKALGGALILQGRTLEALEPAQKAAMLLPKDADSHCNLGSTLYDLGRLKEAESCFRRAIEINPDFAEAHINMGNTLKDLDRREEAAACYRRTIEIKPDYAEAHNNLGNALRDLGRPDEAISCYHRALDIKPDFAGAHNNLGNILMDMGRLDEAETNYRRAIEIRPEYAEAYSNLLFSMNYSSTHDPSFHFKEACKYGEMVTKKAQTAFSSWNSILRPKRLCIGVVSGDLRNHPIGYFLEAVLTQLDQSRVELIAYPTDYKEDGLTARIKPYFSVWKSLVALSDEAAAHLIHEDAVHLLLDLSAHSAKNRLPVFAWKPAPVQTCWMGYPGTTGVPQMDYFLADPFVAPLEDEGYFSETIWRLPESYLCFTPPDVPVETGVLPALTNGYITFGSFNNLAKMGDDVVALWSRVLHAVPGSKLFLRTKQLASATVRDKTVRQFATHNIAPDRLILDGHFSSRIELYEAYKRVDIALDPFPHSGITTSADGLWMGVPFITLRGDRFPSHVGESILHNTGLAEWIAVDGDDYVAKAIAHSRDIKQLAALHDGLRRQVLPSPLFDAPRFARHFEDALWKMWAQYEHDGE
jgi:predicted O-linked N-acetylglucosamine transferase (SPINDLY family)